MGRHLSLEKSSDLLIEFLSLDLWLSGFHLCERFAVRTEKSAEKQSERFYL
jgi:hypothetical protein